MYSDFTPKFVKKYANLSEEMNKAFTKYIEEVKDGVFPGPEHGFKISDDVLEKFILKGSRNMVIFKTVK